MYPFRQVIVIITLAVSIQAGAQQEFLYKPTSGNHPPLFFPQSERGAAIGETITLPLIAEDPDGDTVTFTASNLPAGASLNSGIFTWTPDSEGSFTVTFTADDGQGNQVSRDVSISVQNGGWYHIRKPNNPYNIDCIFFYNNLYGWTSGEAGSIYSTEDGGLNWLEQESGTDKNLYGIHFINPDSGWAAGSSGTILRTYDGGDTWTALNSGITESLYDIFIVDAQIGFVTGANGTIRKTTDGGDSWSTVASGNTEYLQDIYFSDSNTGWIVGGAGVILKTTDQGDTWIDKNAGTTETNYTTYFVDSNNGWVAGQSGLFMRTTDGGDSWNTHATGLTESIRSMSFIDATTGWICGYNGVLLKTVDSGVNWSILDSGSKMYLGTIYFSDSQVGWIGGWAGLFKKTIDGGNTWYDLNNDIGYNLSKASFVNDNTGWAVGVTGAILKTTDGGNSWVDQSGITTSSLRGVYIVNENTGWIVGSSGTILYTADGGDNWSAQTSGISSSFYGVDFYDENTGWAVASNGNIVNTTNGGNTWSAQTSGTSQTLRDVKFVDQDYGWVVGYSGTILQTYNGGANWSAQTSGVSDNLLTVYFIDRNIGWAGGAGGILLYTNNGGITWTSQNSNVTDSVFEIYMLSSFEGYAVTLGKEVLYTNDGGNVWHMTEDITDKSTYFVEFTSPGTGWIPAYDGEVLKYSAPRIDVAVKDTSSTLSDTVRVPVTVGTSLTDRYATGFTFSVQFDSDTLSFVDIDLTNAAVTSTAGITATSNANNNILNIAGASSGDLSGSGKLVELLFTMKEAVVHNGVLPLSFTGFTFNEGNPVAVTSSGNLTIKYRFGDADSDKSVNESDAVAVLQHVVNTVQLTTFQQAESDVTGNGTVSAFDASNIMMYIVGSISQFPAETNSSGKQSLFSGGYGIKSRDAGDYVNLVFELDNSQGLYAMEGSLHYDRNKLEYAGFRAGSGILQANDLDGSLDFALAGYQELTEDAVTLRFRKTVPGVSAESITMHKLVLNETQVDANTLNVETDLIPEQYILRQNYPNPFNPLTSISFALPEPGRVHLMVYNTNGQLVRLLASGQMPAGEHDVIWDGTNELGKRVSSGVYIYRISAGDFVQTRKMVMIK